jgi:hypothetical protein
MLSLKLEDDFCLFMTCSFVAFRSLKYSNVGKKNVVEANHPAEPDQKHCLFLANLRICGLRHEGNLRICDLRFNHYKLSDLQFAERAQEFADL